MDKIIIINYSTGETHVFPYDTHLIEAVEIFDYINEKWDMDFSESNCHYMIGEGTITIH